MRSVERTVESVLLPAVELRAARRPAGRARPELRASPAATPPAGWRPPARRAAGLARGGRADLRPVAPADIDALYVRRSSCSCAERPARAEPAGRARGRPRRRRAARAAPERGRARRPRRGAGRARQARLCRQAGGAGRRGARLPRRAARDGREHDPAPGHGPTAAEAARALHERAARGPVVPPADRVAAASVRATIASGGPATYNGPPGERPRQTSADPAPRGRSAPGAAGARAGGAGALARARRVRRVAARARGRPAVGLLRGAPDRERAAGLPPRALARVQGHLPALQTMRGYRVERKGGWDCHGLPVEIAVEQELGIKSRRRSRSTGSASSTRAAASRCSRTWRSGTA